MLGTRRTCRRGPSTALALRLVVVVRVPLEPAEQIESSALAPPCDVLRERFVHRSPLRLVMAEPLRLGHEPIVEGEVRGHDTKLTHAATQHKPTENATTPSRD